MSLKDSVYGNGAQQQKTILERLTAAQIFEPLPPIPWLCEGLQLAPGAPALLAGSGYAGKTVTAQALAVAVASGQRYLGNLAVKQGRVLHLDYEQGRHLTCRRYQRLAAAQCLGPADLQLELSCHPSFYLDAPKAEEILVSECQGLTLLIVDSLRAALPKVDENSSEVRRHLDMLARVSGKTGVMVLVIHHSRKPQAEQIGGARVSIRGSSGIYEACATVFVASSEPGQPTRLECVKSRITGNRPKPLLVRIDDVMIGLDPHAGIEVTAETAAEVRATEKVANVVERIVQFVQLHPGCSLRRVRAEIEGVRDRLIDASVDAAIDDGLIIDRGDRKGRKFYCQIGIENGVAQSTSQDTQTGLGGQDTYNDQ